MKHVRAGLATGLLIALAAPVAHADVTVRVEGAGKTLAKVSVARTGPNVTKDGATCAGNSAGGALDRAVSGNWTATNDATFGLFVTGIAGENYSTGDRYWGFDVNDSASQVGVCANAPADGSEIVFYATCGSATTDCVGFPAQPLDLTAPATATTGVPFTVTVRQFDDTKEPGVPSPAEGATVNGVTTGADGRAQIVLDQPGTVTLTATKGQQVRDEAAVTVSAPAAVPTPTPSPTATPASDTTAPRSSVLGFKDGRVFKKAANAPRTLRAAAKDASALRSVSLGLTRRRHGHCTQFSDARGAFAKGECGVHPRFPVGSAAKVSYLLPKRLAPGRYTVTVRATDVSGNRERLADQRNRVVFYVR